MRLDKHQPNKAMHPTLRHSEAKAWGRVSFGVSRFNKENNNVSRTEVGSFWWSGDFSG